MDRQTDKQTDIQTDGWMYILNFTLIYFNFIILVNNTLNDLMFNYYIGVGNMKKPQTQTHWLSNGDWS